MTDLMIFIYYFNQKSWMATKIINSVLAETNRKMEAAERQNHTLQG